MADIMRDKPHRPRTSFKRLGKKMINLKKNILTFNKTHKAINILILICRANNQ